MDARRIELEARLRQLDDEIAQLRSARGQEDADDEHDPEGVTISAEWSRLEGLRATARSEAEQMHSAMERLVAGTYGVCVQCGNEIPPARLDARPAATRCVPCAAAADGR